MAGIYWNSDDITIQPFESRKQAVQAKKLAENMTVYAPYIPKANVKLPSCKIIVKDTVESIKEEYLKNVVSRKGGLGIIVPKNREPIHIKMQGIVDYTLDKITIERLFDEEMNAPKDEKKPPKGRSQKQHNLIQSMNKRKW